MDQASVLTLTEIFRIGDETAGDTTFFGDDIELNVDSKGQLYVTDREINGILVYSDTGALRKTIGRAGRGPGEFTSTPRVYVDARDTVYALDTGENRLTIYSPESHTVVETIIISEPAENGAGIQSFLVLEEVLAAVKDGFLVRYTTVQIPFFSDMEAAEYAVVKLSDRTGSVVADTIIAVPEREIISARTNLSVQSMARLPFGRDAFFAMGPDNVLYYGNNEAIEIHLWSASSGSLDTIRVPHDPVQLTDAEWNQGN